MHHCLVKQEPINMDKIEIIHPIQSPQVPPFKSSELTQPQAKVRTQIACLNLDAEASSIYSFYFGRYWESDRTQCEQAIINLRKMGFYAHHIEKLETCYFFNHREESIHFMLDTLADLIFYFDSVDAAIEVIDEMARRDISGQEILQLIHGKKENADKIYTALYYLTEYDDFELLILSSISNDELIRFIDDDISSELFLTVLHTGNSYDTFNMFPKMTDSELNAWLNIEARGDEVAVIQKWFPMGFENYSGCSRTLSEEIAKLAPFSRRKVVRAFKKKHTEQKAPCLNTVIMEIESLLANKL